MSGSGVVREMTRTRKTEAAYTNEQITRQRVDKLERLLIETAQIMEKSFADVFALAGECAKGHKAHQDVLRRGFWGRLCWLLRGR